MLWGKGRGTSKEDLETGEMLMSTIRTWVGSSTAAAKERRRARVRREYGEGRCRGHGQRRRGRE
jgi:hypothetical protein